MFIECRDREQADEFQKTGKPFAVAASEFGDTPFGH